MACYKEIRHWVEQGDVAGFQAGLDALPAGSRLVSFQGIEGAIPKPGTDGVHPNLIYGRIWYFVVEVEREPTEKEWLPEYADEARKIAAQVIAESGLEADRPAIERGEWDGDDHVIIAMRALMIARGDRLP